MNKIGLKLLKAISLGAGSFSLLALSSPWILSNSTCLQFVCSLASAKTKKTIECSGFQWRPFGNTEITSLKITEKSLPIPLAFEAKNITIHDPLSLLWNSLRGKSALYELPYYVEINQALLSSNELPIAHVSLQKSDSPSKHFCVLSLFANNFHKASQSSSFVYKMGHIVSFLQELELPDAIEIPFTVQTKESVVDLTFTSSKLEGSASIALNDTMFLLSKLHSSSLPSYQFVLTAELTKKLELLSLESSFASAISENNRLGVSFNKDGLKTHVHLSHLDKWFKEGYPFTPKYLDVSSSVSFNENNPFSLDFTSDIAEAHVAGSSSSHEWIIETGKLECNLRQASPFLEGYLGKDIALNSLSLDVTNAKISKENQALKSANIAASINSDLPFLGIENAQSTITAIYEKDHLIASLTSPLFLETAQLSFYKSAKAVFVNSLGEIQVNPRYLPKLLGNSIAIPDLKFSDFSFKIPLEPQRLPLAGLPVSGLPISDIKGQCETTDLKVQVADRQQAIGPFTAQIYTANGLKEWKVLCKSEEDRFTLSYEPNQGSEFTSGALSISKLPIGKWAKASLPQWQCSPDFKLDAKIAIEQNSTFTFDLIGSSSLERLSSNGTFGSAGFYLKNASYEAFDPAKAKLKVKLANLSYIPDKKEFFVEEATLESRNGSEPAILGKAKSTDAGLELDLQILSKDNLQKFHLEGLVAPSFSLASIAAPGASYKLNIQADHCPLSILQDRNIPFAKELQNLLGDEVTCSIQLEKGDLKTRFRSNKLMLSFTGEIQNGFFIATKPFFAQVDLDAGMRVELAKWLPNHRLTEYHFAHPINIRLEQEGLKIPISDFDYSHITAKGSIELGQFTAPTPSFGKSILKLLKQKDGKKNLDIWATPVDFTLDHGSLKLDRVDFLLQHKLHLAMWGSGDLKYNVQNYHLGIAQDTLTDLFNLQDLPHDFLLSLPLKIKNKRVSLDLKESLKTMEQFLVMHGAVSGSVPAWLDQFLQLGKYAALPYPPLEYKLPWTVVKEEEATKKAKNKLKPKKAEETSKEKTADAKDKNAESNSTVDKAKEWMELLKIFKVLN